MDFDWSVVVEAMPVLLSGAHVTIIITLVGLAGGIDHIAFANVDGAPCSATNTGIEQS